jgi:lambda family phage portal protein
MVAIIYPDGKPITRGDVQIARARAMVGGGVTPYDASDQASPEMAGWMPWLGSPDTETTPYRDISVSRIRDLVRNDGWASGTVTRTMDAVIGADFRMASIPDYRALSLRFGSKFDAQWAKEFSDAYEAGWRAWAYDPSRWCDIERMRSFPQISRLAFRHYLVEGETIAAIPFRPDRIKPGRARYATCVHLIDPDRMCNPGFNQMDTLHMRGGVEIDDDGAAVAYHVTRAHRNDYFAAGQTVTWDRIPRETEWGRPMFVHHFDADRAGQHRPIGGIFTPVLARMRMLFQYDRVELQAAIVNAIFGAYIESPFDNEDVQASLEEDEGRDEISQYQKLRNDFHRDRRLHAGNVRLATLFPGEKINTISSTRPASAFDAFEGAMLRNVSTAVGLPYETVSGNYRGSTYSSARQSMLEAWKTLSRRRVDFGSSFCTPIASALLEEMFDNGEMPLPAGAPEFMDARAEYSRCRWIGPGRGYVDITKEVDGARGKMSAGLSTLEKEAADGDGLDWIENLDQLKLEKDEIEARGLNLVFEATGGQQQQTSLDTLTDDEKQGQTET